MPHHIFFYCPELFSHRYAVVAESVNFHLCEVNITNLKYLAMKQNTYAHSSSPVSRSKKNSSLPGNFSSFPPVSPEPKGRILSWHWEPVHETYTFPRKKKGVA